jgi:uncharacterized protein YggE
MNNLNNYETNTAQGRGTAPETNSRQNKKPSMIERFRRVHFSMDEAQANRALKITGLFLISLLCLFVLVKTINEVKAYNTIGMSPQLPNSISVNGHGKVTAKRNVTTFTFNSHGEGKTASDAQSKAAAANNKALAYLKAQNVPEGDISTLSLNTYPKYDQKVKPCEISAPDAPVSSMAPNAEGSAGVGMTATTKAMVAPIMPCNNYEQVITGYETDQTIQVKIRNTDQTPDLASKLVDGVAATGVRVSDLNNSVDDIEVYMSEARNQAVYNARIEAAKIAKSLGVRLGKVISYYDSGSSYPAGEANMSYARDAYAGAKSIAPQIPTGNSEINADVSVTFEIR